MRFDFGNHDDIFMENKENALLTSLKPHFVAFMRELKKGTPGKTG
ncbi:MAG: DUF3861 domain-containing protein [Zoogloeaceae bacterium]|nr:DUF3861 domain-containing protein [Zoogloeaceae bacterium]